jgi:hypothetical protein
MSVIGGYRQVGMPITENIGNLGKLKDAVTLKRGILTAKPDIEGRDFYPLLAEVGKALLAFFMRPPSGCQPRVKACQPSRLRLVRYNGR